MFRHHIVSSIAAVALAVAAAGAAAQSTMAADGRAVATNVPVAPASTRLAATDKGAQPLAPDAPRTAPPLPGQAIAEDYRIGPQDLIEIQVYGVDTLRREVRVNSRGVISLPLIGTVALGGLTAQEAEDLLTKLYEKDYLRNPQVSIFIKEFTSQRITMEGAVARPGMFPIKGQTSLLQALAIAGGGAAMSDLSAIIVYRTENGTRKSFKYDIDKIRKGEMDDPMLINDDLVVVNRSAARTALKDSLFRDILDTINPFSYMK